MISSLGSSLIMIFIMSDEEISLSIEFDSPYSDSTLMSDITSECFCDDTSESPFGFGILMASNIVTPVLIESKLTIDLRILFDMFSQFLRVILREE